MKTPEASNHIPGAATLTAREALSDPEILDFVRGLARSLAGGDRPLADDLEQETLLAALRSSPRDPAAIRAWLRSIATNKFRSKLRRLRPGLLGEGAEEAIPSGEEDPAQVHRRNEVADQLARAMSRLPRGYADVVRLRVCDGLPPRTVAAELGIPVETVRSQLRRALARLREDLGRDMDETFLGRARWAMLSLIPARRVAVFGGLLVVGVFSGVMIGRFSGGPAVGAGEPESGIERSTASRWGDGQDELALPTGGRRSGEVLATVTLRRTEGEGGPMGLELVHRDGSEAPVAFELDSGGLARLEGLRTGTWSLRAGADVVGQRTLEHGPQDWSFRLPDHRAVPIRVVDAAGLPRPGVDVYERRGIDGRVARMGSTDEDGELRVTMVPAGGWLAARGRPGELSDSILVGQPWVAARESITLELKDMGVEWLSIVDADGQSVPAKALRSRVMSMRVRCQVPPAGPTTGTSDWLPAWSGDRGMVGRPLSIRPLVLMVTGQDGSIDWASPRIPSRGPLGAIPPIRADGVIEGIARLAPAPGATGDGASDPPIEVRAFLADLPSVQVASVWTGEGGRFEFNGLPRVPLVVRAGDQVIGSTDLTSVDSARITTAAHVNPRLGIRMHGVVTGAPEGAWLHAFKGPHRASDDDQRLAGAVVPAHSVRLGLDGSFEFEAGPATLRTLVLSDQPAGTVSSHPFRALQVPRDGWRGSAELHVDRGAPTGSIRCDLGAGATPATLAAIHVESGAYRLLHVPVGKRDSTFHGLEAGDWRVVCLGRNGGRYPAQPLTVRAGVAQGIRFEGQPTVRLVVPIPDELDGADLLYVDPLDARGARWSRFLEPEELRSRQAEFDLSGGPALIRVGRHAAGSVHWCAEVNVTLGQPAPEVRLRPMAACQVIVPPFYTDRGVRLVAYGRDGEPCGEVRLVPENSQAGSFLVASSVVEITELRILGRGDNVWSHSVSAVSGSEPLLVRFPAPR